jgi:hypothetical protein
MVCEPCPLLRDLEFHVSLCALGSRHTVRRRSREYHSLGKLQNTNKGGWGNQKQRRTCKTKQHLRPPHSSISSSLKSLTSPLSPLSSIASGAINPFLGPLRPARFEATTAAVLDFDFLEATGASESEPEERSGSEAEAEASEFQSSPFLGFFFALFPTTVVSIPLEETEEGGTYERGFPAFLFAGVEVPCFPTHQYWTRSRTKRSGRDSP